MRGCDAICKASAGAWSIRLDCNECRDDAKGETPRCIKDLHAVAKFWLEAEAAEPYVKVFGANGPDDNRAPVIREIKNKGFLSRCAKVMSVGERRAGWCRRRPVETAAACTVARGNPGDHYPHERCIW